MQHNWRYAGGDKARKSAMRQVLFVAGGYQSFGINLFVQEIWTQTQNTRNLHSSCSSWFGGQHLGTCRHVMGLPETVDRSRQS